MDPKLIFNGLYTAGLNASFLLVPFLLQNAVNLPRGGCK